MKLLKPAWISHDGKPIFSIDIHPDRSRVATGGQGEDSGGKIVIWNMAPVRDEKSEKDESVPKMLCQMDNHLACVNCVRWSNNGRYLASGSDDKLVMIWQTSRYAGPSTVFGSTGTVTNVEQWRCVFTLRGHSGDVLDLAWSPHDVWLATCSIDNTIVVWNAQKFPEQVAVLNGHRSLVKGVTWDPVGTYLASQSDDKTIRVWRTSDWQQEKAITEPFEECGGTTHVLRLGWSPDGFYVVSAHAMNNSGPTAQIIERDGWKTNMDFVGHRKAVTVVRFNPNLFSKKISEGADKPQQYSCCAIGSRDRSISIWLTALKRPLVVTHDLFNSSILDITWDKTGFECMCCSWDGTVAYLEFSPEEIGTPLTPDEKMQVLEKVYGKTFASAPNGNCVANQIIETAAMLELRQKQTEERDKQKTPGSAATPATPVANGGTPAGTPVKVLNNKQIETKTADGRRRITPIFLAAAADIAGDDPIPFGQKEPTFTSSETPSTIVVEKRNEVTGPVRKSPYSDNSRSQSVVDASGAKVPTTPGAASNKPHTPSAVISPITPIKPMSLQEARIEALKKPGSATSHEKHKDKERKEKDKPNKISVKRKLDAGASQKRPRKEKEIHRASATATVLHTPTAPAVGATETRVIYSTSGLQLPVPKVEKSASVQIGGSVGSDDQLVLVLENEVVGGPSNLHRVKCLKGGQQQWESVLASKGVVIAGNSNVCCCACEDSSLHIYSPAGRKLCPSMMLHSQLSILHVIGYYVMAVTSQGGLYVWNVQSMTAVIKNESVISIIPGNNVQIESSMLTAQGIPVISLSTGKAYTFKPDMGAWVQLASSGDPLASCSDHHSCIPKEGGHKMTGPLSALQLKKQRASQQAGQLFRTGHVAQQASTMTHLENQVAAALALKSSQEYKFWLLTYMRYLVQEGVEAKIREVCDELLGPVYKSKTASSWESHTLGLGKRHLLQEILPIVGSNLRFQRLFTEYKEQLDTAKL